MWYTYQMQQKGIVQLLVIIVLFVIILSLLGVSISSLINDKTLRENFALLWKGVTWIWDQYLAEQVKTIWHLIRDRF